MSEVKLLKAWLDVVVKMLFERDPELLRHMLETILGVSITSVQVLDPGVYGDLSVEKHVRLDIRAVLGDGKRVDVEVQMCVRREFRHRLVYYGARDYASQLSVGDRYRQLTPTVVIAWLGERLFAEDPSHLHRIFELRDRETGELLSDQLSIHVLQFQDFRGLHPTHESENQKKLRRWAHFFLVDSRAELAQIAQEDPIMAKAAELLEQLSLDPAAARRAQDREVALRFHAHDLEEARTEGNAEGKALGGRLVLQRLLARKFGSVDGATLERLSAASPEELEEWAERVLDAQTLSDVFG
jgi:predicted transposase/invertase (TIGR01784 family)